MVNINQAISASFELHLSNIPTRSREETKEVTLQIYGTVIPSITIDSIQPFWQGTPGKKDSSGAITFGPWNVNFFINSDFSNWRILHDWVRFTEENIYPDDHSITAILMVKTNFNQDLMQIHFNHIWITDLGEVTLNTQEGGDTSLQSTATFEYFRYYVYMPGEEITG